MTESLSLDWFLYDNGLCHEIVKMTLVTSILFFRAENKIHTFEMKVASFQVTGTLNEMHSFIQNY